MGLLTVKHTWFFPEDISVFPPFHLEEKSYFSHTPGKTYNFNSSILVDEVASYVILDEKTCLIYIADKAKSFLFKYFFLLKLQKLQKVRVKVQE